MEKSILFTSESTLAQQCYERLQTEIIEGILKPGEKLKVAPIKERFNVGQSPVREALSRLVASGLVNVEDNKGFRVSTISEYDIRDTYHTFTNIETMALSLAIERGGENWQTEIVTQLYKLTLIEISSDPISYDQWAERNYHFHVALIAGCNSPILLDIRRTVYLKFDRYCRMPFQIGKKEFISNHQEHEQLVDAVLTRDVKRATDLMHHHINDSLEDVITQFKKNGLI